MPLNIVEFSSRLSAIEDFYQLLIATGVVIDVAVPRLGPIVMSLKHGWSCPRFAAHAEKCRLGCDSLPAAQEFSTHF